MATTINNSTFSQNAQDTLPVLLRMVDPEEFAKYDSMTPAAVGYLANNEDAVTQMPYALGMAGADAHR